MFDLTMKALSVTLAGLLTCVGANAGQNRESADCKPAHRSCHTVTISPKPDAASVPARLPPDRAGNVAMGLAIAPAMHQPPSLADGAMPPRSAAALATTPIPASAHAACARRKNGSRITVKLGPNDTVAGMCQTDAKHGGKMQFRARR